MHACLLSHLYLTALFCFALDSTRKEIREIDYIRCSIYLDRSLARDSKNLGRYAHCYVAGTSAILLVEGKFGEISLSEYMYRCVLEGHGKGGGNSGGGPGFQSYDLLVLTHSYGHQHMQNSPEFGIFVEV